MGAHLDHDGLLELTTLLETFTLPDFWSPQVKGQREDQMICKVQLTPVCFLFPLSEEAVVSFLLHLIKKNVPHVIAFTSDF